jgi:hypothetical protein
MTISPEYEIQTFIVSTLKADAAVMALAGGVYDVPPTEPYKGKTAYISLGATDSVTDDADCISGISHTIQIDIWSKAVGMPECKKLMTAVRRCLHQTEAELAENGLCEVNLVFSRTLREPDGLTNHGVMQFEFQVQDMTE